jgi:hypothetical protein
VEHDIAREDPEVQALTTAKKYLDDSKAMIDAADRGDENFLKGAARGFGDKFMDLSTWDFGLTELKDVLWEELNSESNKLQGILAGDDLVHRDKDMSRFAAEMEDEGEDEIEYVDIEDVDELEDFEYEDEG